jgi:predicted RNase H-like nuclease (RuvC/YqgF family)
MTPESGMSLASETTPAAAKLILYPDSTERRLRRALRQLDAALSDQRQAVARFRAEIGALNGAVVRLAEGAESLRGALAGAAAETARAQAASRELLATAEKLDAAARR